MFAVFDLDDTLADTTHREHILEADHPDENTKWKTFFEACPGDTLITEVADVFNALAFPPFKNRVEIWTARSASVYLQTRLWLQRNLQSYSALSALRMRPEGDYRPDTEIKADWIREHGKPHLAFDDRDKVVKWWRAQGVTCFQVRESRY